MYPTEHKIWRTLFKSVLAQLILIGQLEAPYQSNLI